MRKVCVKEIEKCNDEQDCGKEGGRKGRLEKGRSSRRKDCRHTLLMSPITSLTNETAKTSWSSTGAASTALPRIMLLKLDDKIRLCDSEVSLAGYWQQQEEGKSLTRVVRERAKEMAAAKKEKLIPLMKVYYAGMRSDETAEKTMPASHVYTGAETQTATGRRSIIV